MNKLVVLVVLACAGIAGAQPAQPPAAGSAAPATGSAAPAAAGSAAPAAAPTAETPAPAASDAEELRKTCAAALNANPEFAKSVVETYDKKHVEKLDQEIIDQHKAAAAQIAENERHVIWAYAAMWILAALFLVYMWRRQQTLKGELATLRRDLDASAKESK